MTEPVGLLYGRTYGVPEATTAWGARAILTRDYLDIVPNRVDAAGPRKAELLDYLRDEFSDLAGRVLEMAWDPSSDELATVFDDETAIVVASTNASGGYLYLRAWFKADEVDPHPYHQPGEHCSTHCAPRQ